MNAKLLDGNKGRAMLLFHGAKGAAKVLSILHIATRQLQRKYQCTLLCQIGPADQDPLKMKLIARLWPYAGTWQQPASAAQSRKQQEGSATAPPPAAAAAVPGAAAGFLTAPTPGSSDQQQQQPPPPQQHQPVKGPSWLRRGLQGSLPDPDKLRPSVRHLPPFALPVVISKKCTLRAGRTTEPRVLAQQIAEAVTQKGRCRVLTAGGLAALHAVQAVRLADVVMARAWQQGLVMHVECVTLKQTVGGVPIVPAGQLAPQAAAVGTGGTAAVGGAASEDLGAAAAAAAAAAVDALTEAPTADSAEAWEGDEVDIGDVMEGDIGEEDMGDLGWDAAEAAAALGGYPTDVTQQQQQQQRQRGGVVQEVVYYSLTLIAAHRDWDATPSTSVFPPMRSRVTAAAQQQQQGQQQGQKQGQQQWQQRGRRG
jgi:hypothetical protein